MWHPIAAALVASTVQERRIHQLFEVSVLLKGAHALVECAGGLVLAVTSTATIVSWIEWLTQDELHEDRGDFIAGHLVGWSQHFSVQAHNFYAFYLLSHGVVKVALVAGLLLRKLWAYPASLVVLGVLIV